MVYLFVPHSLLRIHWKSPEDLGIPIFSSLQPSTGWTASFRIDSEPIQSAHGQTILRSKDVGDIFVHPASSLQKLLDNTRGFSASSHSMPKRQRYVHRYRRHEQI